MPALAIFACMVGISTGAQSAVLPKAALASRGFEHAPLTPGPAGPLTERRLSVSALRDTGPGDDGDTIPALRRYSVRQGDTLDSIAGKLGLHAQTLLWANPSLQTGPPQAGQMLLAPPVDGVVHEVGAGETAATVAQAYGVSAQDLLDYNGLRSAGQIKPGAQLLIPGSRPAVRLAMAGGGTVSVKPSDFDAFPAGWCTWYVAQRRNIPWSGDAWSWFGSAKAAGWQTGKQPRPGAIMVSWESYWYGHVAYVEKVYPDGSWQISEMNYAQFGAVDFRTIKPGTVPLIGFIY